jgi:hypothetical protein
MPQAKIVATNQAQMSTNSTTPCGELSYSPDYLKSRSSTHPAPSSAQQPIRSTELTSGQCLPLDPTTESIGFEVNDGWAFGVWLYRDDGCAPDQRLIYYGRGPYNPCCNDISWEFLKQVGPPRSLKYQD